MYVWWFLCWLHQNTERNPNQQRRILNKLPTELQYRNYVTTSKHRLSIQIGAKLAKACMQCVYVLQPSFHFACHRQWLGWRPSIRWSTPESTLTKAGLCCEHISIPLLHTHRKQDMWESTSILWPRERRERRRRRRRKKEEERRRGGGGSCHITTSRSFCSFSCSSSSRNCLLPSNVGGWFFFSGPRAELLLNADAGINIISAGERGLIIYGPCA